MDQAVKQRTELARCSFRMTDDKMTDDKLRTGALQGGLGYLSFVICHSERAFGEFRKILIENRVWSVSM